MKNVYVIGSYSTQFKKWPERSFKDLVREAYMGVLEDVGWKNGDEIQFGYFGNCGMHVWGQGSIRGQVCFIPLVREGLFPERVPLINVEGACAPGSSGIPSRSPAGTRRGRRCPGGPAGTRRGGPWRGRGSSRPGDRSVMHTFHGLTAIRSQLLKGLERSRSMTRRLLYIQRRVIL